MKKALLLILILISLCVNPQITIPVGAENPDGGIIDGDSIYWENSWGRLEVYPHTGYGSTYIEQWCNATWKLAANDLDIAFRFNDSIANAHIYELVGEDWIDRTGVFQHTTYNDKHYYYVTNVHFEQFETRRFRWEYSVKMNTTGKWDFMAKLSSESIQYALDNNRYVMLDPWWDCEWAAMVAYTIDSSWIDADLLNFPVLVTIPTEVGVLCEPNGEDIRFVDMENESEYMYEIDTWDASGNSQVWVNITSLQSDSDTQFNLYYMNDGASDNQTPTQVWDDHYVMVLHMTNGTDSTNSYNNATDRVVEGTTYIDNVTTGKIGGAKSFNPGYTNYMNVSHTESLNLNDTTLELWYSLTSTRDYNPLINKEIIGTKENYNWSYIKASSSYLFRTTDDQVQSNASTSGTWGYHAVTRDLSDKIIHYEDVKISGTPAAVTDTDETTNTELLIGKYNYDYNHTVAMLHGKLDEIRISDIARNGSWLNASYHTQNDSTSFCVIGNPMIADLFHMNTTSNVTRNGANLLGWIPNNDDYQGTYTSYGAWVGTSSGMTEGTYDFNFTGVGTREAKEEIDVEATGLTEGTLYYYAGWIANATSFETTYNELSFTTYQDPQPPTDIQTDIEESNSSLEITWTTGLYSDKTVIIKKVGSYPSSVTDGTEVFNASDEDHWEEDLTGNYYLRAWSWNDTFNVYSADYADVEYGALIINCYDEDTLAGLTFDMFVSNQDGSETYNTSYATNSHIIDVNLCPLGNQINIEISASDNYSSQSESFYYDLDENETITYVVLALEPDSKPSTNVSCISMGANTEMFPPFTLDGDLITILADAADQFDKIIVNYTHSQYDSMIFYRDLVVSNIYVIDAYLPYADDTNPYVIQIENEYGIIVDEAKIIFRKYINSTVGWANFSILYTGATGQCSINLLPNEHYKLNISKTGYVTNTTPYYPDSEYYGIYYPAIFLLKFEEPDVEPGTPGEYITLNATMYSNETIHICFLDKADSTIDVYFEIYEIYNNTRTLIDTFSSATDDSFCFWIIVTNTSRLHVVEMDCNHSIFGTVLNFPIYVAPLYDNRTRESDLETKISNVGGDFNFGYVTTLFLYVPCIIPILIFGYINHPGYGVLISGGYAAIVTRYIEFGVTDAGKIAILASLLLVLGVLSIAINYYRRQN